MKIASGIFSILVFNSVRVSSITWYDCTCVPYDQCNVDYTMKEGAKDIHESRKFNEDQPRPVCTKSTDVCCDFANQTSNTNKQSYKWSCGLQKKVNDLSTGEVANAETGEFPWVVAIFRNDYGYYAGGSLINEKAILTAAHKVYNLKPSELTIHGGACELKSDEDSYFEAKVSSIHIHPHFEEESHVNDYAVLILTEAVKPSANVNSICLADSKNTYDPSECIATGWGKNGEDHSNKGDHLQKSNIDVIENEKCENNYKEVYGGNYKIHKSVICAGDLYYKDPCVADAGSPIICPIQYNAKRYVQVGIESLAICNEKNKPGLYADVANGYSWIYQVVDSHGLKTKSFRA